MQQVLLQTIKNRNINNNTDGCTRVERNRIIWLKAGIGTYDGLWRGRNSVCLAEYEARNILLKRSETKKWREELSCSKWLSMN